MTYFSSPAFQEEQKADERREREDEAREWAEAHEAGTLEEGEE